MSANYPVIGETRPYGTAELHLTGFEQFEWSGGVGGLAKVQKDELHLLAIHADKPNTGQFRVFMRECKEAYPFIRVWSVWSANLRVILVRYGFVEGVDTDQFGIFHDVWDWKK